MEPRLVGEKTAVGRSLASARLHFKGGGGSSSGIGNGLASFHAYMNKVGPGEYTPDMCAPLMPDQGRRLRDGIGQIRYAR